MEYRNDGRLWAGSRAMHWVKARKEAELSSAGKAKKTRKRDGGLTRVMLSLVVPPQVVEGIEIRGRIVAGAAEEP